LIPFFKSNFLKSQQAQFCEQLENDLKLFEKSSFSFSKFFFATEHDYKNIKNNKN